MAFVKNQIILILLNLAVLSCFAMNSAFASPSFGPQETTPLPTSAFNNNGQEVNTNLGYAILKEITYFSDGNYLNATYWTYGPPENNIPSEITYGMLIDADSNDNTGYGGIDYIFQIQFKNNRATETLEELTSQGDTRIIRSDPANFELFQKEKNHIPLSLDLKEIGSPDQYKISFFSNETTVDGKFSYVDFSSLVSVPIPELKIKINPSQITVSPGEHRLIQIQVQSNSHQSHQIILSPSQDTGIEGKFTPTSPQKVPSDGLITSNLEVTIPDTIFPTQYSYNIHARAFFEPSQIDKSQINNILIKKFYRTHQDVTQDSFLEINVQQTTSFENAVYYIFSMGGHLYPLISAILIPLIAFAGIMIYSIKKQKSSKKTNKTKEEENSKDARL